ncbi:hypothetical protein [Faucicola atlantae]|uniref:hypothetical protein n=1 Tax=Faucicola atlantae TaxID=34059 RepID=UPI0025B166E9|nr:hypothetical protein [Moraxella atlantae]
MTLKPWLILGKRAPFSAQVSLLNWQAFTCFWRQMSASYVTGQIYGITGGARLF